MTITSNDALQGSGNTYSWRLLFGIAFFVIYLLGSYASLKTGYTWDTEQEQRVLIANVHAVNGLLRGDHTGYQTLVDFSDKYYGIGFDVPASVVQKLTYKPIAQYFAMDNTSAFFGVKQWLAFDLFFVSAVLFFLLSRRLVENEVFSMLATLGYLIWPYLLGQSFIDVKDVPFLFAWLWCTYISSSMAEWYCRTQNIRRASVCLLAIVTGWLITIRIAGGLVLLQYLFVCFAAWRLAPPPNKNEMRIFVPHLLVFIFISATFVYLSYPVFWLNPLRTFSAISSMSHHVAALFGYCTQTLGECLFAADLPVYYIPTWLSVKLPIIAIVGYLALPFTFQKCTEGISSTCILKPAIYASLAIPVFLWATGATLYNEIRHILFLMPLFYLVGVHSLYFLSRKLALTLLVLSVGFLSMDNFLASPYQYVWFNEVSRQFTVEKYFTTDYWGASGRNLSRKFLALSAGKPFNCAYIDGDLVGRRFIHQESFGCVSTKFPGAEASRPYFLVYYTREGMGMQERPTNCTELGREKLSLFMGRDITLGRIIYCQ